MSLLFMAAANAGNRSSLNDFSAILLAVSLALLVCNWRLRLHKDAAVQRPGHPYRPEAELAERSQLRENVKTARTTGLLLVCMIVCIYSGRVAFILTKFGFFSVESRVSQLAITEALNLGLPIFGLLFSLVCVRASSQLRDKAKVVLPAVLGSLLCGSAKSPTVVPLNQNAQEETERHFTALKNAWER